MVPASCKENFSRTLFYYFIGIVIFIAYLSLNIVNIKDYGITTDSPAYFTAGSAYFDYFTGANKDVNTIKEIFHPPVASTLSHITYLLFEKMLHRFDEISAHHLLSVLLASLTILIVYLFTLRAYGLSTAIFATLFLALYPRFLGHAHNNLIDIPMAAFTTLTVWSFWQVITKGGWCWPILSGVFLGVAINTKLNALLIPLIFILWLMISYRDHINYDRTLKKLTISPWRWSLFLIPTVAIITLITTNPLLWHNSMENFLKIILRYSEWKGAPVFYFGKGYWPVDLPRTYALVYLIIATPMITLLFSIVGLIVAFKDTTTFRNRTSGLLLAWLSICLFRYFIPGVLIWDGMRHILEVVPAFCIIAGVGANRVVKFLVVKLCPVRVQKFTSSLIKVVFTLIIFLPLLISIIQIHPFETSFFNGLVGGPAGASGRFDLEYWYGVNKKGIEWLNRHAEQNARVYIPLGGHIAHYYLRPDLEVVAGGEDYMLLTSREGYYSQNSPFFNAPICYYLQTLKPIYTIDLKGAPLLRIFDIRPLQKGFVQKAYYLGKFYPDSSKLRLSNEEESFYSKPGKVNGQTIIKGRKVTLIRADKPFFASKILGYPENGSINYIYFVVETSQEQLVDMKVGKDSELEVWANGKKIFRNDELCTLRTDIFTVSNVKLNKGLNGFLVKFIPHTEKSGFSIRFMKHSEKTYPGYTPLELLADIEYKG